METATWEYQTLIIDAGRKVTAGAGPEPHTPGDWLEAAMQKLGPNGWELAGMAPNGNNGHLLVFKRQTGTRAAKAG